MSSMLATVATSGFTSPTLAPQIASLPDILRALNSSGGGGSNYYNNQTGFLNYLPNTASISGISNSSSSNNQSTQVTRYLQAETKTKTETANTNTTTPNPATIVNFPAASQIIAAIKGSELHYGTNDFPPKLHQKEAKSFVSMMITKSDSGFYVFNNITLKVNS